MIVPVGELGYSSLQLLRRIVQYRAGAELPQRCATSASTSSSRWRAGDALLFFGHFRRQGTHATDAYRRHDVGSWPCQGIVVASVVNKQS